MAEGRDGGYLSPLEEQYIREAEADGDLDQQLLREKDLAAQRLWLAFQDSATAVSHLFRDCQQQAGLSAWAPFHESASAVTQLYIGSSEVCRQCMECGVKYGQRKRTRELVAWTKKKRKHIRRDELLAFLLDKPHPDPPPVADLAEELGDLSVPPPPHQHLQHQRQLHTGGGAVSGLSCLHAPSPCYNGSPLPSPRRRALCREDSSGLLGEGGGRDRDRESSRKRPNTNALSFEFGQDTPLAKRMRL